MKKVKVVLECTPEQLGLVNDFLASAVVKETKGINTQGSVSTYKVTSCDSCYFWDDESHMGIRCFYPKLHNDVRIAMRATLNEIDETKEIQPTCPLKKKSVQIKLDKSMI